MDTKPEDNKPSPEDIARRRQFIHVVGTVIALILAIVSNILHTRYGTPQLTVASASPVTSAAPTSCPACSCPSEPADAGAPSPRPIGMSTRTLPPGYYSLPTSAVAPLLWDQSNATMSIQGVTELDAGVPGVMEITQQLVLPVPTEGLASLVDGTERRTSGRVTTMDASNQSVMVLPVSTSGDFCSARVDVVAVDTSTGGAISLATPDGYFDINPSDGGSMTAYGSVASPTLINNIGYGAGAAITYGGGYFVAAIQGPKIGTTGTNDVTSGSLFGMGGTLDGKALTMNVNGGGSTTLTFNGSTTSANGPAVLAAIESTWPSMTAAVGGSGGNKIVLTDSTLTGGSL